MLVGSACLFSGCVVPADNYYADPYYSPGIVVVPALPYTVDLYSQPYYNYHGYFYFYDNQHWYYSMTPGGQWVELPRTHWPHDTRWKGHHFRNDHRDHKYDRHHGPQSKKPRQNERRSNEKDPRKQYPGKWNMDAPQQDHNKMEPAPDNHNQHKVQLPHNKNRMEKDPRQPQRNPMQKNRWSNEKDPRGHHPGKQFMEPGKQDRSKMKPEQNNSNQRKGLPSQNKKVRDGKKSPGEELMPMVPQ